MKLVSYNIHRGTDISNKPTLKRIIKYLKDLDSDIICLQEVLYHQFIKIKYSIGMDGVFAANVDNKAMKYGICTFSKNKIELNNHILLSSKKEQRGLLHIKSSIDNKDNFNIINTHLGLDKEERVKQIIEILNFKNELVGPTIICGDFNDKNISLGDYYDSAVYLNKCNTPTLPKYNARIDYIFVDKNYIPKEYIVDKVLFSDHYPIICNI